MARVAASCTVSGRSDTGVARLGNSGGCSDPVNGATTVADQAAVEAAVALLETDAATPTQAHVNALRTVWDALVLDIAKVPSVADVVVSVNASNVVTRSALRAALRQVEQIFEGSNALTP